MAIFNPHPLWEILERGEKAVEGNLSVCGSIMVPVEGTGLLPLIFFSPPTPFRNFPEVFACVFLWFVLVWCDSVRGSNYPESGALWRGFSRVGGRDRGQIHLKGDNRGLF